MYVYVNVYVYVFVYVYVYVYVLIYVCVFGYVCSHLSLYPHVKETECERFRVEGEKARDGMGK